ncbi:MAG: DNA polymerase III subunit delta [Candidatus Saganbacteria bacterium]|nr:DNA polymerase III subunit delta [Candidatus Saganbacteria bacterium]
MIYLFHGDEHYLINEEVKRLKKKLSGHSVEKYDAPKIKELVESLKTPSLFTPERLILVSDLDFKVDEDLLCSALNDLDPRIELVFLSPPKLDKRKKSYKLINKKGEVREFKSFADWEMDQAAEWVIKRADALSKKINKKTAGLLVEVSGKKLFALNTELEKLAAYTGAEKTITEKDVLSLASQKEVHVFSFVDALKGKNIVKSLHLQERVLADRSPVITLLALIASQFRTLLYVKLLQEKIKDRFEIARKLGYSPYYIKKCIEQAANFSSEHLKTIMETLYDFDLRLKRGESDKALLPILVEEICSG